MSSELGLGHLVAAGADLPGRSALSRERIIQTAIAFIDQRGLAALTMRRLGTEIGVEAMSLYRHVNGREDLLDAITDQVVAQLHPHSARPPHDLLADPTAGQRPPGGGWQTYLQRLAHAVRAVAREHPNVFPLIATRHPATPWLRPPLRSPRLVEDFLDTLIAHGFSDDQAVQAYRAFSGFLLGHLLLEVSLLGAHSRFTDGRLRAATTADSAQLTCRHHLLWARAGHRTLPGTTRPCGLPTRPDFVLRR